ncbi:carboxymuconolactone decarboxylase family protein [Micromonospora sp. WMMD729]|uniref:carboxymuconolactone decarboxylase family protein n=1 Tax=Micromonospora sp. WMMD729 TaxID=3404127 RepID=UPI003BF55E58
MVARKVASSVAQKHVRYLTVVPAATARGLVAAVYRQVAEEYQIVVPPALLHSPSDDVLAAYWALTREPLLPGGAVERGVKEAVAAAVSVANTCPYCADLHVAGLFDLSGEHDAEAIGAGRPDDIADARLRCFVEWARDAHRVDGPPLPPGLSDVERAEVVGVMVGFHYLSRVVNVFLPNPLLPQGLGPRSRRRFNQGLARILRPTLRGQHSAGRATRLLETAVPPSDLGWATGSPRVADAVARAYRVFEAAGDRSLDPLVRSLVLTRLDGWDGEDAGLDTRWCEELVAPLAAPQRAAARLALLTAFASYRVGPEVVEEFRRHHPADTTLVDVTAWAGYAAARRIGARYSAHEKKNDERRRRDNCGAAPHRS